MFTVTDRLDYRRIAKHHQNRAARASTLVLIASVLGCLLLSAGGCNSSEEPEAAADANATAKTEIPLNVRTLTIAPSDLNEYLTVSGIISPLRGTVLCAQESGQVNSINHDKGALVNKGDILVQLDYELLEANLESARAGAELAEYVENRTNKLYEANSVSMIEMLDAKTTYTNAKAAADIAQIRRDHAAITAPFDGIVADRYVELGELVTIGMPVSRIVDPFVLKLVGAVSEREVGNFHRGDSAELLVDGLANRVPATVHWVGFEADPTSGKFQVEIHIDNPDRLIRPGVVGNARILKGSHEQVVLIPRDAIMETADGPIAYIVVNDRAEERALKLGGDEGLLAVVQGGIEIGDQLIVRGHREARQGCLVYVQETAESADGTNSTDPRIVSQERIVSGL